jgi:molybdate transport system substrate-binding protein
VKFKVLLTLFFLSCGSGHLQAAEVLVAVASNFTRTLEKIAPEFERTSGHSVIIVSGATGRHYAQIVNGAPYDVFLAADAEVTARLEEEGRAVPGTRAVYATGRLSLWSRTPGYVDAQGAVLADGEFRRLSIANPRLAPYGAAAVEVLTALGQYERLSERLVQGENIAQTYQFVDSGNAELGLVAYSQVLESGAAGSYWLIPEDLHAPLTQELIVLKDSAPAREFVAFLLQPSTLALIGASGYGVPHTAAAVKP